jgi:conjugal transfer pilus assembly protein TraF
MSTTNYWKSLSFILITLNSISYSDVIATRGWYYYQDPPTLVLAPNVIRVNSYSQLLETAKQEYQEIEAAAIINPSSANIKAYRQAIQILSDRSAKLAMLSATQNWQDPDSRLSNEAVNGSGLQQDLNLARQEYKEIVKNYGIFYFISQQCKYCKVEAIELKRLEETYDISVMTVSMDGSTIPQYPNPLKDNGFAKNLGITKPGALVAFDPTKNKTITIGYGYLHYDEIMKRIHSLFISGTSDPEIYINNDNPERITK